jgi:hypothetical protein
VGVILDYGYFSRDCREYVVIRPDTPTPWINYLSNNEYCAIISNTAGGYSFHLDPKDKRILRYRYNNLPTDRPGRYLYVRDNKIPAIGLNVPAEITRKVSVSGFTSLTQEEIKKLPPDVGCTVNEQYMQFIRKAYAMHGHGDKQFQFFCEAQLLWNRTMAHNIITFLKKNPEKNVIVLTGNGHAWKKGIPEEVRTISEGIPYKVVLPQIQGYIDPQSVTTGDADYILLQ